MAISSSKNRGYIDLSVSHVHCDSDITDEGCFPRALNASKDLRADPVPIQAETDDRRHRPVERPLAS